MYFNFENNTPFGVAISAVEGLNQEAIDAFWRAGLVTEATFETVPPSDEVARNIIGSVVLDPLHTSLAVALRNPELLKLLVANHPSTRPTALWNPYFDLDDSDVVGTRDEQVSSLDSSSDRDNTREDALCILQGTSYDAYVAASALIRSASGRKVSEEITAHLTGTPSKLGEALLKHMVLGESNGKSSNATEVYDPNASEMTVMRTAVIDLLDGDAATEFIKLIATSPAVDLTPRDVRAILKALSAGDFAVDGCFPKKLKVAAYMALEGESLATQEVLDHLHEKASQRVRFRPSKAVKSRLAPVAQDCSDDEAFILELLGHEGAAASIRLDSSSELSDEEIADALDSADVETIVDWAEGRLRQRPTTETVVAQLERLGEDKIDTIAKELALRPDPLQMQPGLVIAMPGATRMPISKDSAKLLAMYLSERVSSAEQWTVLAGFFSDQLDDVSIIELTTLAGIIS